MAKYITILNLAIFRKSIAHLLCLNKGVSRLIDLTEGRATIYICRYTYICMGQRVSLLIPTLTLLPFNVY